MHQVSDGIYRLGSKWVNFYLVVDGDAITIVDTGVLGYFEQIEPALQQLGRRPADVKAIVLTHTHSDHIGGAGKLAEATGAPVLVHRAEAAIATGDQKPTTPKGFASSLWRPTMLAFVGHYIANKGTSQVSLPTVTTFEDDEVLDVPGQPRIVYSPGHSPGHSAVLFADRNILFCGDALATLAVNSGATGPMLHPFNEDRVRAIASLGVLETVAADVVLPGHGDPWNGTAEKAVRRARTSR